MAKLEDGVFADNQKLSLDDLPSWLPRALFVLSLVGICVASYLFYAHLTDPAVLACPENGTINCAKVTTSAQSKFLGLPVSLLGLAFFVSYSVVNFPAFFTSRKVAILRLAMAISSIGFVLWLVYAELLIINAICLWCSVVHLVTLISFVLVVFSTVQTGVFRRL